MAQKTVAVIGTTGLIGSFITGLLKEDTSIETIRLIVRRPITDTHPKVEIKLVNFEDYESLKLAIDGCQSVFCAVGTTQKKVQGDKLAYRKADYDVPVHAARASLETRCDQFLLVSAVGANAKSSNFYLQLKGEVEEAIQKFPIPFISIFRPSMLLGPRKEFRLGEKIGQVASKLVAPLLAGKLKKYKPIEAKDVASAMVNNSKENKPGVTIFEYAEMQLNH